MAKVTFLDEESTVKETVKKPKAPVVLSVFDDLMPVKKTPKDSAQKSDDDLYMD